MGVRGLTAFLKQGSLSSISDHVDFSVPAELHDEHQHSGESPQNRRLLIVDGNAFSHWFTLECFGSAPSVNTNYRQLKRLVVSWIMKCYATKVDCIFVFDGATEPDKLQCRLDRLCRQSANMDSALSQEPLGAVLNGTDQDNEASTRASDVECNGTGIPTIYQKNSSDIKVQSTPPLLAISCIINAIGSLQSTDTRAFYARGEADKTIVEVAVALQATAIMSNDSDMLIYNSCDVGFIPFWGFGFADDGSLNAFVIKRKKVSNLMGISEINLPILAVLVGNDFTSAEICHHIHKILFEGPKQCSGEARRALKNQQQLSVDSISLSQSDALHDEMDVSIPGRQGVKQKPRIKRSDSSLSSSERTKLRRRANRAEEGNKRKANQSKFASSLEIATQDEMQVSDVSLHLDITDETAHELKSSASKDTSWSYGESGLKTVKAAALFLKKAECAKKSLHGNYELTALGVTSLLLGMTEGEVLSHLAESGKPDSESKSSRSVEMPWKGVNKIEFLCTSFYAAIEDSIARYKVLSAADVRKYDSLQQSVASYSRSSALRCCFRCYSCLPLCRDLRTRSLAGLLAFQSKVDNRILPNCTAAGSADSSGSRLQLSPDMDQVLKDKMFIGRTPCSLLSDQSTTSAADVSLLNTSLQLPVRRYTDDDDERTIEVSSPRSANIDYKLLQPLRRRLYSEIFSSNCTGDINTARNRCSITEIFKKNKSRHLEKWTVQVPPTDLEIIGTEILTSAAEYVALPSSVSIREILLRSLLRLVIPGGASPLLYRIITAPSIFSRVDPGSIVIEKIKIQMFFIALTAHLFLTTVVPCEKLRGRIVEESSLDIAYSILAAVAYLVSSVASLISAEELHFNTHSEHIEELKKVLPNPLEQGIPGINEDCNGEESFYDKTFSLPFINLWTSVQLCLQHVNFSVEAAAYVLPQLQRSVTEVEVENKSRDVDTDVNDSSVNSALHAVLGGDPGLLDPILFHRASVQLQQYVLQLLGSCKTQRGISMAHSVDLKQAVELFLPPFTPEGVLDILFTVVFDIIVPASD
jgi:hypothetical protein